MQAVIQYTHSIEAIFAEMLEGFFVNWPNPPSPWKHLEILKNSDFVVLALDRDRGRVIGLINAISDKLLCAYIPLLEVLPKYQGRGIGSELTRRMLAKLQEFYMVDVLCDPALQGFYEAHGMTRTSVMMIRNYDRQSGTRQ